MKDDRALKSLFDALEGQESIVDETLVRSVLAIAQKYQFDTDRTAAREELLELVSDFVDQNLGSEEE